MSALKKIKLLPPAEAAQYLAKQVSLDIDTASPLFDAVQDQALDLYFREHPGNVRDLVKRPHASPRVLAHGAFCNIDDSTQLYTECAPQFDSVVPVAQSLSILMRLLAESDEDKWAPKPQGVFLYQMLGDLTGVLNGDRRFAGCVVAMTANEQGRADDKFFLERLTKEVTVDWDDEELEIAMEEMAKQLNFTPWTDRIRNKIASLF